MPSKITKKSNRGGKRPGTGGARPDSGRKEKYGEPTTTIAFRVPVSKKEEIKTLVDERLETYKA